MKNFLLKNWYYVLMLVLSIINAVIRLIVHIDTASLIWLGFAIVWVVLLRFRYKNYPKEK